jgi:hypothetical protein
MMQLEAASGPFHLIHFKSCDRRFSVRDTGSSANVVGSGIADDIGLAQGSAAHPMIRMMGVPCPRLGVGMLAFA